MSYTHLFFFNDTATTEIYTLSLHDALPIWIIAFTGVAMAAVYMLRMYIRAMHNRVGPAVVSSEMSWRDALVIAPDRKSTRLNSSHANISYAVFCLKQKKHFGVLSSENNNTY